MDIRFLGHAAFEITHENHTILIDPWLTGNPVATTTADELSPTAILLSHGHADHYGDTEALAKRTGADVLAIVEIAEELTAAGVENVHAVGLGGTHQFDWGWARLVPAWHTSTTPKGLVCTPAGIVVGVGDHVVYHVADTALFSDLALPGRRTPIDVALIPIGGTFTMDRFDAVEAARLIDAKQVIPCHYDTFPAIETDVAAFKADVEDAGIADVVVLAPGESHHRS
jgi:L-ascorbate metabolism protein UlaG (beta-lactamase superfamily)